MDFQKVLEALDHLIENRVESAAYTRMLTAIVQDIENSENNTYKVSYDNGQTITIAVSIASNGNEIQYQKGDSVQLLQYNGIGNTNTTLYILGKSADSTEQNLADLADYLFYQKLDPSYISPHFNSLLPLAQEASVESESLLGF